VAGHRALRVCVKSAEMSRYSTTQLVEIIVGSEQSKTDIIYVAYLVTYTPNKCAF
jgi:hypothetical protein